MAWTRGVVPVCDMMVVHDAGETWNYGTKLMELVIKAHGIPLTMWYDINCRFKQHAIDWAEAKWGGGVEAASLAKLTAYPLPPFHVSCHNATCQWHNSHMRMYMVGLGAGEPPEIAWAHMRKAGHILQYQSLSFRHVSIERIVARWNESKVHKLIPFMMEAYMRATTREAEARRLLNAVVNKMRQQQGASDDKVGCMLPSERVLALSHDTLRADTNVAVHEALLRRRGGGGQVS